MAQTALKLDVPEQLATTSTTDDPYRRFIDVLSRSNKLLCTKCYRVDLSWTGLPHIPCLDHEAQLQGNPDPHVSVYIEDGDGCLHEVGIVPQQRRIVVDAASTIAETPELAREQLTTRLRGLFPEYQVVVQPPSYWRGDRRVAAVVRSQVRLREVLLGDDATTVRYHLERMRAIAELMEKESRVSSWGIRTLSSPLLAAAGVVIYKVLGMFGRWLSPSEIEGARYLCLLLLGGGFVYIGMKAVHLTEMGTRVWKRATEYKLILDARERAGSNRS